jgi:cytochrome c-type biogenesis protein CcmE
MRKRRQWKSPLILAGITFVIWWALMVLYAYLVVLFYTPNQLYDAMTWPWWVTRWFFT